MLTVGSLFSGIGGMDLGLERAGMIVCWMVEIDPFCQQVLAKHWPDVERFGDVRECGKHNLAPVDLICGGAPCQPHSVAGKRRGSADDRDLWPEYRRIVEELRPNWVLFENVPGIQTTVVNSSLLEMGSEALIRTPDEDYFTRIYTQQEYLYLDSILQDLEVIGYEVAPLVVPACAFNAPHRRERVFVVAYCNHSGQRKLLQSKQKSRSSETSNIGSNGEVQSLAYADDEGLQRRFSRGVQECSSEQFAGKGRASNMADAEYNGSHRAQEDEAQQGSHRTHNGLSVGVSQWAVEPGVGRVADGISPRLDSAGIWDREPNIPRVARGIPNRVDRLRTLGNAVVPAVAQWLGEQIVKADSLA